MDNLTTDTMNLALKLKKKVNGFFQYFVTICSHMHNTLVQYTRCTGRCTMQH